MQAHTSCRHYRGHIPCKPNKLRGKECPDCDEFDPIGPRVLLIKLGAPGDVLRTTCLLPGIKRKWPGCELTWLTRENARDLLGSLPQIDRALTVESEGVLQLTGEAFDTCINLDNDPIASSIATQIKAGGKLGFHLDNQGRVVAANIEADEWLQIALFDRLKKENRKSYQAMMRAIVGLDPMPHDTIQVAIAPEEKERARLRLESLGLAGTAPVAFNTGSGGRWKTKKWPMESFLKLSDLIRKRQPGRVLLLGGPEEHEANTLMVQEDPDSFIYPGVMPLREFMALVGECSLLVTADTLALHVGLGTGVRTLALFGPTSCPEIEGCDGLVKVEAPVDCVCCYLKECSREPFCMDTLAPKTVLEAILDSGWIRESHG
jgi:heptosyltransferase-2